MHIPMALEMDCKMAGGGDPQWFPLRISLIYIIIWRENQLKASLTYNGFL